MATITQPPSQVQLSRWAAWEANVLSKVDATGECINVILQRQREIDDDDHEAEEVRAEFLLQLRLRGHDPDHDCVFIRSKIAAMWLGMATNERVKTNKATEHIKGLGIPELTKTKKDGTPGWRWTGSRLVGRERQLPTMTRLRELPGGDR